MAVLCRRLVLARHGARLRVGGDGESPIRPRSPSGVVSATPDLCTCCSSRHLHLATAAGFASVRNRGIRNPRIGTNVCGVDVISVSDVRIVTTGQAEHYDQRDPGKGVALSHQAAGNLVWPQVQREPLPRLPAPLDLLHNRSEYHGIVGFDSEVLVKASVIDLLCLGKV